MSVIIKLKINENYIFLNQKGGQKVQYVGVSERLEGKLLVTGRKVWTFLFQL